MKRTLHTAIFSVKSLLAIICLSALASCEKVIDLDLNNAEKKYVIEANVSDVPGAARVLITQTKNFDEDNNFPGITGATVTVTENGGATSQFTETADGVYEHPTLVAQTGKTYTLNVTINGNQFSAVSVMPQKVNLDTIYVTDEFLFTEFRKIVNVEYKDPAGRGNAYRFTQYFNGTKQEQTTVSNDDYTDGRNVDDKLFYFAEDDDESSKIKSGDHIKVEFQCINAAMYKYWYSLERSATGVSGQATPANPVSNMQGGALGYFSTHTYQEKTMIVP